jgi:hypothetical protein
VKRLAMGLAAVVVMAQVGCGSSNKGSPSATDAAGNDAEVGEPQEAGTSPTSEGGADAGDATVATGSDAGHDATIDSSSEATGTDAAIDSSSDATGEAAAAWTPASLTGLVLWLDGHTGLSTLDGGVDGGDAGADAGPPVQWLDQSGNGNNALGYGPAIHPTALDGQPAVHFGGSDYLLVQDSTTLDWGTNDFVLAVVVQHTTFEDGGGFSYGTLYSKQIYDTAPYVGVGLFANIPGGTSSILEQLDEFGPTEVTSGGTGYNDGTPFVVVIHRAGNPSDGGVEGGTDGGDAATAPTTASMSMLINAVDAGFASGTGYAENVDSVGYPARIGGTQGGQNLNGDIAEVIAIEGPVSAGDLANLQAYLISKYGL